MHPSTAPELAGAYYLELPEVVTQEGQFATRIVGVGRQRASQFLAHPDNPHIHPQAQRTVIHANLETLGWVGMATVNRRTGYLIDGHERVWQALEQEDDFVPYLMVDLSEAEESQALATYDPIGDMARYAAVPFDHLLQRFKVENAALAKMLGNVLKRADAPPPELDVEGDAESEDSDNDVDDEPPLSPVVMAHLFLTNTFATEFLAHAEALYPIYGTDNLTDTVVRAIEMRTLVLSKQCSDAEAEGLAGKLLDDSAYDLLIEADADIYKADGAPLLKFRKRALTANDCRAAYDNLREAATQTDNRGMAGGEQFDASTPGIEKIGKRSRTRYQTQRADGTLSKTDRATPVQSGIVGYFDRNPRYPYCRLTAFNLNQPDKFSRALPLIRSIDRAFADLLPERYAAQKAMVESTSPDFYISGTVFTTITVNLNFQTAVHKDVGDYAPGFGTLTALRSGRFDGCYLCMPQYRVAVDLQTRDLLLMDVHQWHGNTTLFPRGRYERLSLVCYYREAMQNCGTHAEELDRAKRRRPGDPIQNQRPSGKNMQIGNYWLAVISNARPANVPRLQAQIGGATWYIGEGRDQEHAYAAMGAARVVIGGTLVSARNQALEDAFRRGLLCVQISDDLESVGQLVITDCVQKKVKRLKLPFGSAVGILIEALRAHAYFLAGAAPIRSLLSYTDPAVNTHVFILGDFMVIAPNPLRFEYSLRLKEDYDYTAQHFAAYGGVCRCGTISLGFTHRTNRGGAVDIRTPELERESIARLRQKWGNWIAASGRGDQEIMLRLRKPKED